MRRCWHSGVGRGPNPGPAEIEAQQRWRAHEAQRYAQSARISSRSGTSVGGESHDGLLMAMLAAIELPGGWTVGPPTR